MVSDTGAPLGAVAAPFDQDPAAPAPAPATTPARARQILILLSVFSVINLGDKAVLGLAGPSMIKDLHLSNTRFGLIGSAFYLLFSLSALLVGLLGGHRPGTWLLAGLALVWSAAQLPLLVPAAGFAVLIVTRVLLGAGEGPSLPMANHVAFTWFPAAERTTTAGIITMGGALGVIVGGPLLAIVITLAGWRWAFGLLGLMGLAWTLTWLRLGGEGPYATTGTGVASAGAEVGPDTTTGPIPVGRILSNPTWIATVVAGFTGNWALGLGLSWLPTFLEHQAGYASTTVGFLVALPSLVAVVSVPTLIYLARRRRRSGYGSHSTYALLGFGAAAIPSLALLVMTVDLPRPALLVSVAIAFGAGVSLAPLTAAAVADLVPVERRGLALCIGTAISSFGAVISPWATGRLLDLASSEASGFDAAFRVASALALVGGISLLFVNPERDARRLLRGVP
jgi:MFS family permease